MTEAKKPTTRAKETTSKQKSDGLQKVVVGKNALLLVGKRRKVLKGQRVEFTQEEWDALPTYYQQLFTDFVEPKGD